MYNSRMSKFWNKFDKMMDSFGDMMDNLGDEIEGIVKTSSGVSIKRRVYPHDM